MAGSVAQNPGMPGPSRTPAEHPAPVAVPHMSCIVGGAGSGKTEALVRRAAALVAQDGVDPADVLVVVAGPAAREAFLGRLAELAGERGRMVQVVTPRALELTILGCAEARALTGRRPRLLTNFETNVLVEDLKVGGIRPGRLREMLKFLYRGWTELADDDPTWLVSDEELELHALLKECLAYTRGVLPCELANLAVRFGRADADAFEAFRRDHVLVDDYQTLCRASQVLAGMLARASLTVAGDPRASVEVLDPYPYAAGLEELAGMAGVEVERLTGSWLPAGVAAAAEAFGRAACAAGDGAPAENVCDHGGAGDSVEAAGGCATGDDAGEKDCGAVLPGVSVETFASPEQEIAAAAERVAAALSAGVGVFEAYVAVPNRVWSSMMAGELARRGIHADAAFDARMLNGDVRDLARCVPARVFTLLALVADPADDLAWRSWCGFGDWLAASTGAAALRRCPLPLHDALAALNAAGENEARDVLVKDAAGSQGAEIARDGHAVADVGIDAVAHAARRLCGELTADEEVAIRRMLAAYREGVARIADLTQYPADELLAAVAAAVAGDGADRVCAQMGPLFSSDDAMLPTGQDGRVAGAHARTDSETLRPAQVAARAMMQVALCRIAEPGFFGSSDAVRIGPLDAVRGTHARLLVVTGCTNGLMPSHAYFDEVSTSPERRARMHAAEARRLYGALGACDGQVLFTSFTAIDALRAERLGVKVDRYRAVDGRRMAQTSPSVLLAELGWC